MRRTPGILIGLLLMLGSPALAQLRTLAPNAANEGIAKTLFEQIGAGRGDTLTLASSALSIGRDGSVPSGGVASPARGFARNHAKSCGCVEAPRSAHRRPHATSQDGKSDALHYSEATAGGPRRVTDTENDHSKLCRGVARPRHAKDIGTRWDAAFDQKR
jgi:hypothetical protein